MSLNSVPKLVDLVDDPRKVSMLPPEAVPVIRGELAKLDSLLPMRAPMVHCRPMEILQGTLTAVWRYVYTVSVVQIPQREARTNGDKTEHGKGYDPAARGTLEKDPDTGHSRGPRRTRHNTRWTPTLLRAG